MRLQFQGKSKNKKIDRSQYRSQCIIRLLTSSWITDSNAVTAENTRE